MIVLNFLIALAWKSALGAGLVLAILRLLRARSAAEKSLIASLGLLALLALPIATASLPEFSVAIALPAGETMRPPSWANPVARGEAGSGIEAPERGNWEAVALLAYGAPAGVMLGLLLLSLIRLYAIRARAVALSNSRWRTQLEAARGLLRMRRTANLLVSEEIDSPISVGFVRPAIILDRDTVADRTMDRALILHELAHVARLDWVRLLLARVTCAIFWFNPLVWLLVWRSYLLCEAAADDAVLENDVIALDYAALLVRAARRAGGPVPLPTNGMVTERCAISARVARALQQSISRAPASRVWHGASFLTAIVLTGTVAAARPVLSDPILPAPEAKTVSPLPRDDAGGDRLSVGTGTRRDRRVIERASEEDRTGSPAQPGKRTLRVPVPATQTPGDGDGSSPDGSDDPGLTASRTVDAFAEEGEELRQRGAAWSERGRLWAERGERLRQDGIDRVDEAKRGFADR